MMIVVLVVLTPMVVFATSPLNITSGDVAELKVYDAQGKSVDLDRTLSDGFYEGWIVRTEDGAVALGSPVGTIVLQPQSILGVSKLTYDDPLFYLVSGTATFQTDAGFTGTLNVATPVSRYQISGTGEIWVSSDIGELIYSFGGDVQTLNVITHAKIKVPSFHYLDMMIPRMDPKPVNQQAYMSMAHNPSPKVAATLPGTPTQPVVVSASSKPVEVPEPAPTTPPAPVEKATPTTPTTPTATLTPVAEVPQEVKVPAVPVFSDIIDISPMTPAVPLFDGTAEAKVLFPETPIFASLPTVRRAVPNAPVFKPTKVSYYHPQIQVRTTPNTIISRVEPVAAEPVVAEEEPAVIQEPAVVEPQAEENKLIVRQPSTMVSRAVPVTKKIDGGVEFSYMLHFDGSDANQVATALSTFAIKPYFSYNTFKLGLQATVSSSGSWKWNDLKGNLKFDASTPLHTVASLTSFIDYLKFGTTSGKVYFNVDSSTPISFGVNSMMGGINHRFDKTSKLGFYNQVNTSWYGHQIYFDDLYLTNLLNTTDKSQTGGVRFRFTPVQSYPFSIGVSTLVAMTNKGVNDFHVDLYPSLDFSFPLINTRKLRLNLNIGTALYLPVAPSVDFTQIYDKNGSSFLAKFPNLLGSAGLEASFAGAKLGVTFAYNKGQAVLNLINNTSFSGQPMTTGDIFDIYLNGAYAIGGFQVSGSWNIPFCFSNGFAMADLVNDASNRKADVATLELGYSSTRWNFGLGLQQIDMIGSYKQLFGTGDISTKFSHFLDPNYTNVYASVAYDADAVRLSLKLSTEKATMTNFDVAPVLDLGMTLRLGTGTVKQFGEAAILARDSKIKISGSLSATYVNRKFSDTGVVDRNIPDQILFIEPKLMLDSDNFSMGFGINFGMNLAYHTFFDPSSWYAPRGDRFWDFGFFNSANTTMFDKVLDMVTDVFSLVDHLRIGKPLSSFYLTMDREKPVSFANGTLVSNLMPNLEAPYFTALPLYNKLSTRYFGYELFVDDMTFPTLAGLSLVAKPTATSYPVGIGLSAVVQANRTLDDSRLYPAIDVTLPIIYNKGLDSMSFGIHVATAAKLSKNNGNAFLLLDGKKLKNYLLAGSLDGTFGNFDFTVAGGVQSGLLSYGMFDEYYPRVRSNTNFVGDETADQTIFGNMAFGYSGKVFSAQAGYTLEFTAPGFKSFNFGTDTLNLALQVNTSAVDVSIGFVKQNLTNEIKNLLNTKPSLANGLQSFFVNKDAIVYSQLDVKAGLATLSARFSTTATYDANGEAEATLKPSLSMGMKIGF